MFDYVILRDAAHDPAGAVDMQRWQRFGGGLRVESSGGRLSLGLSAGTDHPLIVVVTRTPPSW